MTIYKFFSEEYDMINKSKELIEGLNVLSKYRFD